MKLYSHLAALILLSFTSLLLAEDVPGSKDPMGLKRYDGTRTTFYEEQAFGSYTLPLGKMSKTRAGVTFEKSQKLEGKITRVTYVGNDPERTALEVYKNYQTAIAEQGWSILWEGSEEELSSAKGQIFAGLWDRRPGGTFTLSHLGGRFMAAQKGGAHLALYVVNYKVGTVSPKELQPEKGVPIVALDVIESATMDEKMVVVKADEMASKLIDQGGVNLYGFYFDTASATLKSESGPTLDEVEKLLLADKSLRLLVVGHTDGVGGFEDNMDLSKRRAASVVAALSQRVPAAAARLTPCGVGFQCPIASNSSEEGRAKNRRVALVKVEK
ncbi:MAG: OmpA family protein [Verrucomicrobiota bacterium]